jgi:hypothetical protein
VTDVTRILSAIERGKPSAAEQTEPVERRVTLKIIKPGMTDIATE